MIDFRFVESVLDRSIKEKEQASIQANVALACRADGFKDDHEFINLAHNYKCVILLALGDSGTDRLGEMTKQKTGRPTIVNEYQKLYDALLAKTIAGRTHSYPEVVC